MCDLAAWVWRIAKMGPTEKLVAFDAFLAGIAGVGGEAVGRSDAAAVGVAFAAGFSRAGFDAQGAEEQLESARDRRAGVTAEREAERAEEAAQTAEGVEAKADAGDPYTKEAEDAARCANIACDLADCQLSRGSAVGYDLIATIADNDLPAVIAFFVGDGAADGEEHNHARSRNANLAFANAHGFGKLRETFTAFFGECCAGEHKGEAMARHWSKELKNRKREGDRK